MSVFRASPENSGHPGSLIVVLPGRFRWFMTFRRVCKESLNKHETFFEKMFLLTNVSCICHVSSLNVREVFYFVLRHEEFKPKMSPVKRICVFEHSVMLNFNCACPAIQRVQGSGFLSEGSS